MLIGLFKQGSLICSYFVIVYPISIELRNGMNICLCEQLFLDQQLRADQKCLSCKDRIALVGRIAVARRSKRKHLPQMLSGHSKKINKFMCPPTHITDAVWRRERGGMYKNTAITVVSLIFCCNFKMHNNFLVFHVVTIFFLLYVTARRNTRNNHGLKCFFSSYR